MAEDGSNLSITIDQSFCDEKELKFDDTFDIPTDDADESYDDHIFVSMMSNYATPNIDPDKLWYYLRALNFNHFVSLVGNIAMKKDDNLTEEEEEEDDDDQSVLSNMEETDVILETPPYSDDDDNHEDLYPTSPLVPVLVHTPDVSDEE